MSAGRIGRAHLWAVGWLALTLGCRGGGLQPFEPVSSAVGEGNVANPPANDPEPQEGNAPPPAPPSDPNVDTASLPVPHVAFVGRWAAVGGDNHMRFSWPGVAIGVRFRGTQLAVDMQNAVFLFKGSQLSSYFDVAVDGVVQAPFHVTTARQTQTVVSGLPAGEHTVWITKRTEAIVGATDFWGVSVGAGESFLSPPAHRGRRIQVVGGSDETGYGVEATDCGGFQDYNENQDKAWPQVAADSLGAELMNIAYSGKGLCWNLSGNPGGAEPLITVYEYADANDPTYRWAHADQPVDIVILDVGGNDWNGAGDLTQEPVASRFKTGAVTLATRISAVHGQPWIYWAINSVQADYLRQAFRVIFADVVATLKAQGITKTRVYEFVPYTGSTFGCDGHPPAELHAQDGNALAEQIRLDLMWP